MASFVKYLRAVGSCVKKDLLLFFIVLGVLLGFLIGALVNDPVQKSSNSKEIIMYISFPGEILMRMLKMIILPLIVSSLIVALAVLEAKAAGKLGRRALLYYLTTTILAVILGIILVVSIKPGEGKGEKKGTESKHVQPVDSLLDLIRNCFPDNLVAAASVSVETKYKEVDERIYFVNQSVKDIMMDPKNMSVFLSKNTINPWSVHTMEKFKEVKIIKKKTKFVYDGQRLSSKMNILGIVCFSVAFGAVLSHMGESGRPMTVFFTILLEIVMKLVTLIIWYSPIGICSLIAGKVASMESIGDILAKLGLYMATVISGLLIHALIVLPLGYFIFTRKNPFKFIYGLRAALLTAFGTSSSSATLPVTIKCLEENNHIDQRVSRFVLPIGATVNMDGTALYEAVAAIFIAQLNDIDLSFGEIIITCITATAASVGAAGVPQAGLVTMLIVLQAVGLPVRDVSLIVAVDWFLDRIRTTVNVLGDSFGAGIVEHLSRHEMKSVPYNPEDNLSAGYVANVNGVTPLDSEAFGITSIGKIDPKTDTQF
ncbi:excitatory amino acid transporter-like [Xenia sp. Carnegie-2017]|uniref:excitatory amino acid transporter-like n=1 Tax=Xenia sp. Carnegie-2017 TaxID=2897299 RepID=UPI001F03AB97|nr:excitatory amino acid transporter-like [Xenia sp. Carnegie-2017]